MKKEDRYLRTYIKSRITGKDRFSHMSYTITHKSQEFCFEFVGMFALNLVNKTHSMSYVFATQLMSCGCGESECIHKTELRNYFDLLLLEKYNSHSD